MATNRKITVVLGSDRHLVGELIFESDQGRQQSAFRYHDDWLESSIGFALSPAMPLRPGWETFSGIAQYCLPVPISDTAPDSWGRSVIRAHLGREVNELEMLLAVNDETRTGALRYLDERGEIQSATSPPVPRTHTLTELREMNARFERGDEDLTRLARELRGTGDSLGGARPKSAIYDTDDLAIAKYTSERDTMPVERMEVATLRLASLVGIRASSAKLELPESNHPVAVIHRFDRIGEKRVHYISGRSFLNRRASDAPAFYSDLAEVMRGNCGEGEHALAEIRELYRRTMFTILVSNTDDHLKNHGFLHRGSSRWALSPAFDINPQPYRQKQLKTGISELSGFEPSIEALIEASALFEIEEEDASSMVLWMAQTIRTRWRELCAELGMTSRAIDQYSPAFDHREMDVALRIGQAKVTSHQIREPTKSKDIS